MNWKTRQLFSDREHGIVSGLSPLNMVNGGSVPIPGYQTRGDVLPQLGHTHPELHSHGSQRRPGSGFRPEDIIEFNDGGTVPTSMPVNMTNGGNVPYPSYQDGGTVPPAPKDISFEEERALSEQAHMIHMPEQQRQMIEYALEEEEYATIEQRVAELAAQQGISVPEARGMILDQVLQEKGLTLPIKIINQFATGSITLHDALSQAIDLGATEETSYEAPSWKEIWEADISNPAYNAGPVWDKLRYPAAVVTTPINKGITELAELLGIEPGVPPEMQAGTGLGEALSIDLFQQGDQDINEPLNRMAQAISPSIADITPAEKVEETITLTEDQGPTDTEAAKAPFQQMAFEVVKEATMSLAREDYMNIEQVQQEVEQQLTAIDETYRQQTGATDTILTEEFLAQLDNLMVSTGEEFDTAPGMEDGGNVYDINALITSMAGKGVDPAKIEEIIKKYYPGGTGMSEEMLQNRISRARRGALLGGKTKQGGWAGMMDILGQADAAEVAAIGSMPETLATNEAALKRLAMTGELEAAGGAGAGGLTADAKKMLMMQAIMGDPNMPQDTKDMLLKGLAGLKPGKEQKIDLIKSFMKDLLSKSPSDQKKTLGKKSSDPAPTEQEIAAWAANLADAILGSLSGKKKER